MTTSITGSDGGVPIYQPDDRWTTWRLAEIYTGTVGKGRYVPKVNDYVVDTDTDERYIVTDLDLTTLVPTLKKVQPVPSDSLSDIDVLLGVGPGTDSDTYRVYLDTSVMPHTLAVDARLKVHGSMATKAKIFMGSELLGTQKVISAFYDQTGTLLGQEIPLELVAMPQGVNYTLKCVPVCYTTEEIPDGEVVSVVFYSDAGHVVSKRQLLVENTAFIRSSDASVKYVSDISLESPFMSSADPTLLQYPLNVPLAGLNLMGRVHYSDGSSMLMPVDGTKFAVFGLENFVATIVGQKIPLVLRYNLSEGEIAYGLSVGSERFISEVYRATTLKADGAYSVKLFGYPVWIDSINGYRLEWFLYNLDRQAMYRVTPYVQINANTRAFDPIAYGVNQKLSVSLNLKDVDSTFSSYIHTQTIEIVLMNQGSERTTNWTIAFESGQNPVYGKNNFAATTFVNQNLMTVNLAMGETTLDGWLNRLYYLTKPLIDPDRELTAPAPDYFAILIGTTVLEFTIAQWNAVLSINQVVANSDTMFIKFFKRTVDNDIQLAIAGVPVYQQN